MAQVREENRLISLIENRKMACQSNAQAVRNDIKTIDEASAVGLKWAEIAEGLGFPGKDFEVRRAYSRENARRERKGVVPEIRKEVISEKKKEPVLDASDKKEFRPLVAGKGRLNFSKEEIQTTGFREIKI